MKRGTLWLIPTLLAPGPPEAVVPAAVLAVTRRLTFFIAENEKTARRYLKAAGTSVPLNDLEFAVLNKHTRPGEVPALCAPLLEGRDAGLISEAGMPGIADPGAAVTAWCHQNGITVKPLTGPSSILLALTASGFNGQHFTFHGYLPIDASARKKYLKKLERSAEDEGISQIFMETPFRNDKLLNDLLHVCRPSTHLCIARDITGDTEFVKTAPLSYWKKQKPTLHKHPAIFVLGKF